MDILKHEICKLLTKRTVLILVLLIVINPLIQLYTIKTPNEDGYSLKDYSEIYREVSLCNPDDILAEIEEGRNKADTYGEYNLYGRVYQEVKSCIAYDEYLDSVDEKASEIAIMNRFVDDGGYAVRNAEKTSEVYRKIKGIEPEVQDPMALLNITDNELTDYLAIIMIFIIALNLVFYEKSENQLGFLRTTANGRRKLMAAKVAAMLLSVLFVHISLYGMNAVISRSLFGVIDYSSPIQSICVYQKSPFGISIAEFLTVYFLAKILSCFLLGTFFMLLSAVFNSTIFVFVSSALTVFVEIICHTKISGTHFLAFFKYMNIMYGVNTGGMFSDYVNLNLFGIPVNTCFLYWLLWLSLTAVLAFLVINYLESTHERNAASVRKLGFRKESGCHTSLFLHESYKMLVPGRCLIVLVISLLFVAWWNPAATIQFDSVDEIYYKDYMDRFYGPLDYENREMINEEKLKYDQLYENIAADYEQGKSGAFIEIKYKDELSRQNAFNDVIGHIEYLESVTDGWMFFDKGYDILTNNTNFKNRDIIQAFVYVIMLIAMTFGVFGLDYSNSEMRILRSTYRGRGELKNIKCVLGVSCALLSFVLVYIVHTLNILRAYGTGGINAPAASMEHMAQIPQNISVLQYLLIIMLMRFVGGLIVIMAISALFRYLKNSVSVIISLIAIFIIPLALVGLDVTNAQYILINPLLLGNVF